MVTMTVESRAASKETKERRAMHAASFADGLQAAELAAVWSDMSIERHIRRKEYIDRQVELY